MRRFSVAFAVAATMTGIAVFGLLVIRLVDWIIGGNWLGLAVAFSIGLVVVYLVDIATDGKVTGADG